MLRLGSWLKIPEKGMLLQPCSLITLIKAQQRGFSASTFGVSSINTTKLNPEIYLSNSDDPYFNLAFEDWLFRRTDPSQVILYMYRNRPSVIVGRNQNPWKEVNLRELNKWNILFVRRKSGGGTVYHDLGNTNYCIYVPRASFERKTNAELVTRALRMLEIPAQVNERNDICVNEYKVSGSAFKLVNARAYHHGTMLIDAKLDHLRGVLGTSKEGLLTKGVASYPSPVKNLIYWNPGIRHKDFVNAVAKEFTRTYGGDGIVKEIDADLESLNDYTITVRQDLMSWDWMFGQTPEFTHTITGKIEDEDLECEIHSRHGLITKSVVSKGSVDTKESTLKLFDNMIGDRYGTLEKTEEAFLRVSPEERGKLRKIVDWLKSAM